MELGNLTQLIGQNQARELLEQAVASNRIAPAYLFCGPNGVGRCLAAHSFSRLLMSIGMALDKQSLLDKKLQAGNHPDLLWVQPTYLHQGQLLTPGEAQAVGLKRKAPPQIRLEQIRGIIQFLSRGPLEASRCVVVIEDAHTMAEGAANALLKTLEEPGKATFIVIAPSVDSLLSTLVSRCQRIPFYRLGEEELKQVLQQQGYSEILSHAEVLAIAQGSPGVAIASFTQLQNIESESDLLSKLKQIPSTPLEALLLAQEIDQKLDTEAQLWLVDYLQYYYWDSLTKTNLVKIFEKTRQYLLAYVQPRLVWESTLLELLSN